jgi:methoxymalonate biosynthesis protein
MMVKCVIWDLDNTLLSGVYLESPQQPPGADPAMLTVAAQLRDRGIIHAVATRNPSEAAHHAAQVTGLDFAATECGWGRKSDAVRRIVEDLGLAADAVAFVDDDLYERAEVSFAVPEALVLSPEDMADAVGWPEFSPAIVTAEARRRGEMYAERRRRQEEARAFGGSRDAFLVYCGTQVVIGPATAADAPRLHELSVRTHQFNTTGEAVSEAEVMAWISSAEHQVTAVRLADRFGDDGLVGGCAVAFRDLSPGGSGGGVPPGQAPDLSPGGSGEVVPPGQAPGEDGTATVTLLMMSCRAMGRGVIEALLAWLARSARQAGAATLVVPCLISPRNVPLRLALAASGFRAAEGSSPGEASVLFFRPLSGPLPDLPSWVADTVATG